MSSDTGTLSFIGGPGSLRFFPAEESQHRERVFKPDFRPGPRGLAGCLGAGDLGWARCVLPRASPLGLSQCRSRGEGRALGGEAVSGRSAECPRAQRRAVGAVPWTRESLALPASSSSVLEAAGHAPRMGRALLAEAMPLPPRPQPLHPRGHHGCRQSAQRPHAPTGSDAALRGGDRQMRAGSSRASGIRHSRNSELLTGWKTPSSVPATAREQPESVASPPETTLPARQAQAELLSTSLILPR